MDDQNPVAGASRHALQTVVEFQPIATRSMFWRPNYLDHVEKSGWMEHIPFAFWLIEAHRPRVLVELGTHAGTSYFAFCQAVERLGLDTRCFAVDTWKGDAHSGFYAESVFERVRAYNDAQYSGFSRLVRSTFDQALTHFSDRTVDLLHIDGLHTLEAVTHDFDSWADKLSERAIVVMHDTNVRERGFEVFALFEQLKQRFPTFEFVHGHGLGVVAVGAEQGDSMRQLFAASGNQGAEREIRDVFARLGRACADSCSATREEQRARELSAQVDQHKQQLADALQALEKLRGEQGGRSKDLADARTRLQGQVEQHALERGQLAERVSVLKETREELKATVQRLQAQTDGAREELDARLREIEALKRQTSEAAARIQQAEATVQARDGELARTGQDRERAVAAIQSQQAEAAARLRTVQTQHADVLALQLGQIAELKQAVRTRETQLAATEAHLGDARQQMALGQQTLSAEIVGLQQRLQASEQHLGTREQAQQSEIAGLALREQAQKSEIVELQQRLQAGEQAQQNKIAELQQRLQAGEQAQQNKIAELQQRLQAGEQQRVAGEQAQQNKIAGLERQLHSSDEQLVKRDVLLKEAQQTRDEAEFSLKLRFAETAKLTAMTLSLKADIVAKDAMVQNVSAERNLIAESLQERVAEIAAKDKVVHDLKAEVDRSAKSVKDRFAELAKQAKRIIALEHELEAKTSEANVASIDREGLRESLAAAETERHALARSLAEAHAEARRLRRSLSLGVDAMALLQGVVEQRDTRLHRITASRSWRFTAPLRRREHPVAIPPQSDEAQLLRQSGLFDAAWYLERYPDVAESQTDPVLHYLEFGAAELRDPSPAFSTAGYLEHNPDVEASGVNPLRHFVEHGRGEGRIAPVAS